MLLFSIKKQIYKRKAIKTFFKYLKKKKKEEEEERNEEEEEEQTGREKLIP